MYQIIFLVSILACVTGKDHSDTCHKQTNGTTDEKEYCRIFLDCCDQYCPNETNPSGVSCESPTENKCSCTNRAGMDYTGDCLSYDKTKGCPGFYNCCGQQCKNSVLVQVCPVDMDTGGVMDVENVNCTCNDGTSHIEQCLGQSRPKSCHRFAQCCKKNCPSTLSFRCSDQPGYIEMNQAECTCFKET